MPEHLPFPERRKPGRDVTPAYEDAGIFPGRMVRLTVALVPLFGQNRRGDLMIKGFVSKGDAIDIVFAGRRRPAAKSLRARVEAEWIRATATAKSRGKRAVVDDVRLPVQIEGAWRPRFQQDDQGWQTHEHQLFAARWAFRNADGTSVTHGRQIIRPQPDG